MGNITQNWVDILLPFSDNYAAKLSASSIARITNIPQQTLSRYLNELAKFNLINYTIEGRNKLFYLDFEKQTVQIIFNLIENQKALYFQLKQREISVIINEILKYCDGLILFGSYASGKDKKGSDIDIIIFGKADKEAIKKIKKKQTIEINEHYSTFKDFEELLISRNTLAIEIRNNHIIFGDISRIVNIFIRRSNGR